MKLWIAREKSGLLCLHNEKPTFDGEYWLGNSSWAYIDLEYFPEVTFENSPKKVKLILSEE